MNIQIGWTGIGVIFAILAHAGFTVWWAANITNEMKNLSASLIRLDKELEKRDVQISAVWKRVDVFNERLIKLELKES